jgi:hypothetical protein
MPMQHVMLVIFGQPKPHTARWRGIVIRSFAPRRGSGWG